MSVLGNIANRLKTDIGENYRAAIDVNYSRQLTEDRFNQRAMDKAHQRELQIREQDHKNRLAEQAAKQKLALQITAGDKLFQAGQDTGNWGGFLNYIDNPKLNPMVKDYVTGLAGAQGTKSLDRIRFDHKVQVDFDNLEADQQRAALDRTKYETDVQYKQAQLELKKEKYRFEKMQDLRETNNRRNNRTDMIRFIEETPDIESEAERSAFLTRLKSADASPEAVNKVWDEIMRRMGARLAEREKNHRAKLSADSKPPLPIAPSGVEVDIAKDYLLSKIPDEFDSLPDKEGKSQKEAMSRALALRAKQIAREKRVDMIDVLPEAFEEVKRGLTFEEDGGWFWFDKGEFSTSDVPASEKSMQSLADSGEPPSDTSEEQITFAMEKYGMTRAQVIRELWRRKGVDAKVRE